VKAWSLVATWRLPVGVSVALEFVEPRATPANSPSLSTVLAVAWLIRVEGLALTVESPQDIDSFFH
jgi:threonine/homoserine efflux transporter RhtA